MGGVNSPIIKLITTMTPKCIGSTPSFVAAGRRTGKKRSITGTASRMQPMKRKKTLARSRKVN